MREFRIFVLLGPRLVFSLSVGDAVSRPSLVARVRCNYVSAASEQSHGVRDRGGRPTDFQTPDPSR